MSYKHTKIIRFLSLCLSFLLFFEQTGLAQGLPSAIATPLPTPPLLRYLSVNPANPFNYFNFLLDKGLSPSEREGTVSAKALSGLPKGTVPDKEKDIQYLSEQLMKEIILPEITNEINSSQAYAPLRQIYHSLILAQWFKSKYKASKQDIRESGNQDLEIRKSGDLGQKSLITQSPNPQIPIPHFPNNPYIQAIDKGYLKGLESELPWSKQLLWQEYLKSYQQGEYKLKDKLFGLNRMYFSGGIDITKGIEIVSSPLVASDITSAASPVRQILRNEMLPMTTTSKNGELPPEPELIITPHLKKVIAKEEIQEASSPMGLSAEHKPSQPKPAGVSPALQKDQSAFLETEEEISRRKFIKKSGIFAVTLAGLILLGKDILADIFPNYKLSLEEQRILRQDKGELDIVSPQYKDSLGTDNWRRYDSRKLLEAWSPPLRSKFLDYVKTKLIDSLDFIKDKIKPRYSEGEKNSEIGIDNLIKSGILDKHTAVILDSGGAHSVAMAVRLMKQGYQPIVMFNNIPHSKAANRSEEDLATLLYFAEEAKALKDKGIVTKDSPPVFILDTHRDGILLSGDFNNLYRYSSKDFPAAKDLKEHKITKIIYLNEANQDAQIRQDFQSFDRLNDDLEPIVESWISGGIKVFYTGIEPWKEIKGKYIINQSTVPLRKDVDESLSLVVLSLVPEEELHFVSETDEQSTAAPLEQAPSASSAVEVKEPEAKELGGIDLSTIELTLKDEKFVSSLNPAERKVLLAPLEILSFVLVSLVFLTGLAAKYFQEGWEALSLLYVHEIILLLKDNLIKDIQNRDLLFGILNQLKTKDFLDPQALQFLNFLHSQKPLSELKVVLYR